MKILLIVVVGMIISNFSVAETENTNTEKRTIQSKRNGAHQELSSSLDDSPSPEWIYSPPAKLQFTKTEITVAQFERCVIAGACMDDQYRTFWEDVNCNFDNPERYDHPMNCVNYYGAEALCQWISGRLPTAAEWYKEASNSSSRDFAWGDKDPTCEHTVMSAPEGDGCGQVSTWPVCSKNSDITNSGLCDITGNVAEWVSTIDQAPSFNGKNQLRGGTWKYDRYEQLLSDTRTWSFPDRTLPINGIRCVK